MFPGFWQYPEPSVNFKFAKAFPSDAKYCWNCAENRRTSRRAHRDSYYELHQPTIFPNGSHEHDPSCHDLRPPDIHAGLVGPFREMDGSGLLFSELHDPDYRLLQIFVHLNSEQWTFSDNELFERFVLGQSAFKIDDFPKYDMSTTAGLWVKDDEDLDLLLAWIHNWPGPLSVVMTTEDNLSSNYSKLLYRIRDLENRLGTSQLSLHLLHIRSHNTLALNVYLNFARLFALTSRIVLFPTPISQLPPRDLYGLIGMQDLSRPAFITTPSRAAYPFNPLSPILLMRNHSIWCTERHFVHSDRAAEWRECIWQIWTESLGKASKIIMHGVSSEDNGGRRETDVIHTRTSTIYRIEYCDLILRSFAPGNRSGPKTSLNWLKHFCAETVDKRYRL
ncbi:hypothetical protein APHAL10511_004859 [Amanita phalloides]|nr:hypothetical protein APHAL10511_004859 [Amanita phalloides]